MERFYKALCSTAINHEVITSVLMLFRGCTKIVGLPAFYIFTFLYPLRTRIMLLHVPFQFYFCPTLSCIFYIFKPTFLPLFTKLWWTVPVVDLNQLYGVNSNSGIDQFVYEIRIYQLELWWFGFDKMELNWCLI